MPVSGNVIRPMLGITRQEVECFNEEWCLRHIEDSSNGTDAFLRNRIRHHVMPLLRQENPRIGENLSAMALRLRKDEEYLSAQAEFATLPPVESLKTMDPAVRSRMLERLLKESGVREPEQSHIAAVEALLFSERPSARVSLPGGVTIARNYGRLEKLTIAEKAAAVELPYPGEAEFGDYYVICETAEEIINTADTITVQPVGMMYLRGRESGDAIRLRAGTKSLKKLLIDRKIPASLRDGLPVVCDEVGILGVCTIGVNLDRAATKLPAMTVRFIKKEI